MSQPTALQPSHFIIICTFAVAIGHFVLCSFYSLHYLLHLCLVGLSSPKIIEYLWSSHMAWFDWSMQNKNYPLFLSICDNKKAIPKLWWIKSDLQKQDCDADPILHTSQEFALLLEQKGSKCRERDKGRHREKKKLAFLWCFSKSRISQSIFLGATVVMQELLQLILDTAKSISLKVPVINAMKNQRIRIMGVIYQKKCNALKWYY